MRALAVLVLCTATHAQGLRVTDSLEPGFPVSAWRLLETGPEGRHDLLLIGAHGEVRTWTVAGKDGAFEKKPRGSLTLPAPRYTLLQVTKNDGLVALSAKGVVAYPLGADGAFAADATSLAPRARFRLRTNEPVFSEILQDVNGDKRLDLIVPGAETAELWIRSEDGFARAARVAVAIDRWDAMDADALSDRLATMFRIPRLRIEDVNGDGRRDLLVHTRLRRAFHMQRADGSIPAEPDVDVDLSIFRDTTPKAAIRPGRTVVGSDKPRIQASDLDADGIPDYVIAHRRKVWIFHGNKEQPQFTEPTSILKVSDDITALMVTRLDDDPYPDLLVFKVHVPSIAGLLIGVLKSLEIEILARGYRNEGGKTFSRVPKWKSVIEVKMPPLATMLTNPGEILSKVEDVGRKFRVQTSGDLDGDGAEDTLLLSEDKTRMDVWMGAGGKGAADSIELQGEFRRALFDDDNRTWDLDRILTFFSGLAERRNADLTGGKDPAATLVLRDPEKFDYLDYRVADVDGKKGDEIVIRYLPAGKVEPVFDVVRLR